MIYYFILLYGILTIILLVTVFNLVTAPMVKNGPYPKQIPKVSVLIPCRNEDRNIQTCLAGLCSQDYPNLEIFVLDDHSQDKTAALVTAYMEIDPRIRLVHGKTLPAGWTGKNWACHQLSQEAQGKILLFTDADNFHAPFAVSRTVGWMEKLDLDLLSAFPQQITQTWAEKLIVPIFDLFVYSLLPLWLTYRAPQESLSAANGQWIAFTRYGYDKLGGHASVQKHIVEDTTLIRRAKRLGLRTLTTSGCDAIFGRMYHNLHEVWYGFAKNAFGLMNFQITPFFLFLALLFFIYVIPFFLLAVPIFQPLIWPAVAIILFIRLSIAVKFKQPIFFSVVLHPIGILATLLVGLTSFYYYLIGAILWKGRAVAMHKAK